jgi:hypothetical protein
MRLVRMRVWVLMQRFHVLKQGVVRIKAECEISSDAEIAYTEAESSSI